MRTGLRPATAVAALILALIPALIPVLGPAAAPDGPAVALRSPSKEPPKAIAGYTQALRADPADSHARIARAEAYEAAGRYAEAMAGYAALIRQDPLDPLAYSARGRLELVLGLTGDASADLAKAVSLKPSDPYAVLWLHLARNKEEAHDAAELEANAARADRTAWPGPVLDSLTGRIDASQVLASAGEGQDKAMRLCEAGLFLGQDALSRGRRSEGLPQLQAAAGACEASSHEARLIRADLAGAVYSLASNKPRPQARGQGGGYSAPLRGSLK